MLDIFFAYKRYPYHVPFRVKVLNAFRYFFRFAAGENFIGQQLAKERFFFRKFIPPVYFYKPGSFRHAQRDGLVLKLDLSQLIEHEIFFSNYRIPGFKKLLSSIPSNGVVLDIGANIGYCTLKFAKHCPMGKVYAFEPMQRNFSILHENVQCNNVCNVELVNLAVGETIGTACITTREKNNAGASRIVDGQSDADDVAENVSVTSIDDFVNEEKIDRIDTMKIDVEGFELFVLRGASATLRRFRPTLFVELSSINLKEHNFRSDDLLDLLDDLNYDVVDARTLKSPAKTEADIHTDLICYPKTI